jgi:hypothetical protein
MNGQQKTAVPAPKSSGAPPERCYASQTDSTSVIKGVTEQDFLFKAPKNLIASGSMFRRHVPSEEKARTKDPVFGAGVKKENGNARRQPCPTRGMKEQQLEGRMPREGGASLVPEREQERHMETTGRDRNLEPRQRSEADSNGKTRT